MTPGGAIFFVCLVEGGGTRVDYGLGAELGCWWTVNEAGAILYGFEDHLDRVHIGINGLRVAVSKSISKSAKSGWVIVKDT